MPFPHWLTDLDIACQQGIQKAQASTHLCFSYYLIFSSTYFLPHTESQPTLDHLHFPPIIIFSSLHVLIRPHYESICRGDAGGDIKNTSQLLWNT